MVRYFSYFGSLNILNAIFEFRSCFSICIRPISMVCDFLLTCPGEAHVRHSVLRFIRELKLRLINLLTQGAELDDFVSGPRELLLKLVEDNYPLPQQPVQMPGQYMQGLLYGIFFLSLTNLKGTAIFISSFR